MKNFFIATAVVISLLGGLGALHVPGAYAQQKLQYTPLEPLPGLDKTSVSNIGDVLATYFKIALALGGMFAVGALVVGGVTYMVSDIANKKSEALKRIQSAFWGLLLLIGSWLILNTINPNLLRFDFFKPENLRGTGQPTEQRITTGTERGLGELIPPSSGIDPMTAEGQKKIQDYTKSCEDSGGRAVGTYIGVNEATFRCVPK